MSHYIFYIDDSGTKEYAAKPTNYSYRGNTKYFCFGGVLIERDQNAILGEQISNHKKTYFGTDQVEIKSNWLRIPKERNSRYLQKYSLTDHRLTEFVESLYEIVSSTNLQLMAAIINKEHMQEDYENPWYPPALAYEVLMQRVVQEVLSPNTVSIVVDDMDGATPKGNQYKANLKAHHKSLRQTGSRLKNGLDWGPLQGIKFIDSAKSHHIQVADIVAYNVYRQFVEHGELWENKVNKELLTYSWFEKLAPKLRNSEGRIQGYGVVKMPLRHRVRWGL